MRHTTLLLGLPLFLLALCGQAGAAGTPAGTPITNQATAEATSENGPISVTSNTVTTTVASVCSASVTPDGTPNAPGQTVRVLPGEEGVLTYRLANVGNLKSSFALSAVLDQTSGFTPGQLNIYQDQNDNGQLDPAERGSALGSVTLDVDAGATLFLVVSSAVSDRGQALVSLNAGCGEGGSDNQNYGAVSLDPLPSLSLSKSFSPAQVRPGESSSVTLTASNGGPGASREVIVTDVLNTPALAGSHLLAGSASASAGTLEYSADGSHWQTGASGGVAAIRLRVPSLAAGQSAVLRFTLVTDAGAENRMLHNQATLSSSGVPDRQAGADLTVRYNPAVALGPVGMPEAPEGSDADRQQRDFAVVGQPTCFTQTLENSGDVADDYRLDAQLSSGQAQLAFTNLDGTPLAQPVHLEPGARLDLRVCLTPGAGTPIELVLTASGTRGTANRTTDRIIRVETRLPVLTKSVDPVGQVQAGQALTYTLTVHNPYDIALSNLTVRDPLDADLRFVSASDGGTVQDGAVVWTLATLAPGETRRLSLQVTVVQDAHDGDTVKNTFTLTGDQFQTPLPSPTVSSPVWTAALAVTKSVNTPEAGVGELLGYTVQIHNTSTGGGLAQLTVTDTLPAGTRYVPGTARLEGAPLADPQVSGQTLTWTLGELGPQQQLTLTYNVRIGADAQGDLVNVVRVTGQAPNSAVVASNQARARLKLRPGMFAPLSQIVGRVFVDRNRDGVYQPGLDTPLERARVVLADGRLSLTDTDGRYHFADVPEGFTALRLDPASVPYAPLSLPQDGGRPGSRGVMARGLVSVDFPLAALIGEVSASRETTLHDGPLTVLKQVGCEDGLCQVTLTLTSAASTGPLSLNDPLPAGAQLQQGQNTAALPDLGLEPFKISYTFTYGGAPEAAVTDPTVTWRTP